MIMYKNDCCDCATAGYPCIGKSCPNQNVPHYYCDSCKEEVDLLYRYFDGKQLCENCILSNFQEVE